MAVEITIPKLGLTMTEATLVDWLIGAEARVTEGQPICLIETDKVSLEIEAPAAGLIHPIVEPGQRVEVGELIGYVAEDETEMEALQARHKAVQTVPSKELLAVKIPQPAVPEDRLPARKSALGERIVASPAARRHAEEMGIGLSTLWGSGPGGRIVLMDVEKAAKIAKDECSEKRFAFGVLAPESEMRSVAETITIRGIRKIIARNMKLSLSSQAQLTLHTEASACGLCDTRALFNARLEEEQMPVSYNAIIVKAAASALRRYPMLNAVVEGRDIKIWKQIHIGMAMDFGKGLIVPKVRNADTKSIRVISDELGDLVERARQQKLLPDELQEGTFTITNLGNWDVDGFTPITNFPESAILGIGRIIDKPWVRDGEVVAEPRIALSLTFDHRIIDGALGARFLKTLKDRIEDTRLML